MEERTCMGIEACPTGNVCNHKSEEYLFYCDALGYLQNSDQFFVLFTPIVVGETQID